jgi:hypothetical protein
VDQWRSNATQQATERRLWVLLNCSLTPTCKHNTRSARIVSSRRLLAILRRPPLTPTVKDACLTFNVRCVLAEIVPTRAAHFAPWKPCPDFTSSAKLQCHGDMVCRFDSNEARVVSQECFRLGRQCRVRKQLCFLYGRSSTGGQGRGSLHAKCTGLSGRNGNAQCRGHRGNQCGFRMEGLYG